MVLTLIEFFEVNDLLIVTLNNGFMKKTILLLFMSSVMCITVYAQKQQQQSTAQERRETRKIEMQHADSLAHQAAQRGIEQHSWVLEANQISHAGGEAVMTSPDMTFLSMNGLNVTLQVVANNNGNGINDNGLGGKTVTGKLQSDSQSLQKDGTLIYQFVVMGAGLQASVQVSLYPGTNNADAYVVYDNGALPLSMSGVIVPYENSGVVVGNPEY